MFLACLAAAANPGAIFGLLAIFCWLLLLCTVLAYAIVAVRRNHRGMLVLSAFLLGALLGGTLLNALAESLEQGKGVVPLLTDLGYSPQQVEMLNPMFLAVNDPLAVAAVVRGEISLVPNLLLSEAKLRANKVPALALNGELDPRKSDVDALAGLIPRLKVVVIPAANHMTAFRNAEFLNLVAKG